ncbi:MAG: hypothetical protein IJT75_05260 [Bacteroidaceae bacterium]|nr:hypothetical protein [Bacteroidaceae bacterium]
MSTIALNGLFEYITNSLSEEELIWLVTELNTVTSKSLRKLEPYSMEEINARIDESERQIAAGECSTTEEVFSRIRSKYEQKAAGQLEEAMAV